MCIIIPRLLLGHLYELVTLGLSEYSVAIDYRYRLLQVPSQRMYLEVTSLVEVRDCSPTRLSTVRQFARHAVDLRRNNNQKFMNLTVSDLPSNASMHVIVS